MRKRRVGDGHAENLGVGEIGQRLPTGRMLLAEDQLALRSRDGPPLRDAPLQRAQHALVIVAMAAAQLFEEGGGAQIGQRYIAKVLTFWMIVRRSARRLESSACLRVQVAAGPASRENLRSFLEPD
jgi:hypothetical protein